MSLLSGPPTSWVPVVAIFIEINQVGGGFGLWHGEREVEDVCVCVAMMQRV